MRAGQLTGKAIDLLLKGGAVRGLQALCLLDQSKVPFGKIEQLMKKHLQVSGTGSDSAAWGCVLQQTGRWNGNGEWHRRPT